jgi:hypothetical protein
MRVRLALLVAASMALVLVAFVVPLAVLVRSAVANREVSAATLQAQALSALVVTADPDSLALSVEQLNTSASHPVTVFLPDGTMVGPVVPRDPAVQLAARGRSITVAVPGGREILVAVRRPQVGTIVIRTFVSDRELSAGVVQAWLVLGGIGLVLLAIGVLVADRLVFTVVRPIGELARVSHRLAGGELDARAAPVGPRRYARWPPGSTISPAGSGNSSGRSAKWSPTAMDISTVRGPLPVAVAANDLAACLDSLLGNVSAHTPEGTSFAVHLTGRSGGGARLTVTDTGPGFAAGGSGAARGQRGRLDRAGPGHRAPDGGGLGRRVDRIDRQRWCDRRRRTRPAGAIVTVRRWQPGSQNLFAQP